MSSGQRLRMRHAIEELSLSSTSKTYIGSRGSCDGSDGAEFGYFRRGREPPTEAGMGGMSPQPHTPLPTEHGYPLTIVFLCSFRYRPMQPNMSRGSFQ